MDSSERDAKRARLESTEDAAMLAAGAVGAAQVAVSDHVADGGAATGTMAASASAAAAAGSGGGADGHSPASSSASGGGGGNPELASSPETTTAEEERLDPAAVEYAAYVRKTGVPARRFLQANGMEMDDWSQFHELDEATQWRLVASFIQVNTRRPMLPRSKLPAFNTFADVVELIRKAERIVVLTGAGISVSCGIPDFRSATGVYERLKAEFDLPDPQSMFDMRYFRTDPQPFFSFAKDIYPGVFTPSPSHFFIRLLETKGKLLRNYSQNIDTLEAVAGIENVVNCHGSFATATCLSCGRKYSSEDIRDDIMAQRIPRCQPCLDEREKLEATRIALGGHEGDEDADNDDGSDQTFAVVKPDITFFGEDLPDTFRDSLMADRSSADLLLVIGSSLKVEPVSTVINHMDEATPQVLINREVVAHPNRFDVELLGNSDVVTGELIRALGWQDDFAKVAGRPLADDVPPPPPAPPALAPGDVEWRSAEVAAARAKAQLAAGAAEQARVDGRATFMPPCTYLFHNAAYPPKWRALPEEAKDDEATLDEEEALDKETDGGNELDELANDADVPLEELLARYGYNQGSSDEEGEEGEEGAGAGGDDESSSSEGEDEDEE